MMKPIPMGALLTVTTGAYSDYTVAGVFRAIVEIDADKLLAEWLDAHPEQKRPHKFDDVAFFADIARRGMVEQVECWELHLGDYSNSSEMWVSKMSDND